MRLYFIFFVFKIALSFQLDNEIIGTPKIECNPDNIRFSFQTKNPFRGNVYIRGYFNKPSCRQKIDLNSVQGASLAVGLGDCGMTRIRQLSPRGFNEQITFVANFHPLLATKEDRSFNVRCFYHHMDDTIVKADIDVNALPAESLEQATTIIPKCEYSLRVGALDGPRAKSIMMGVPIYHRWDCDTNGSFGILMRKCALVDSHASQSYLFIDENGCPISNEFPELVYSPSLTSAYTVIEAVAFPDTSAMTFTCEIFLCDKSSGECDTTSPPVCNRMVRPSHVVIGESITETLNMHTEEPWMKEQTPLPDDSDNENVTMTTQTTNNTSIDMNSLDDEIIRIPRLTDDQFAVESNHVERTETRRKRLAEKVIDIYSDELIVHQQQDKSNSDPTFQPQTEIPSKLSNCVSTETLVLSAASITFIFVLSLGLVIYLGGHFTKKRREIEEASRETSYYMNKF